MIGSVFDCVEAGIKPPRRMVVEAFRHPKLSSLHTELILGKFWKYVSESNKNYYAQILGSQPEHAKAVDVKRGVLRAASLPVHLAYYRLL